MEEFKEKRRSERLPINADSSCEFASPVLEDFGRVKVKNISTEGIGFLSPQYLQPGLLLALTLVNAGKKFNRTYLVRVVHGTAQPGGMFLIGGTFNNPLSYEELCVLVM